MFLPNQDTVPEGLRYISHIIDGSNAGITQFIGADAKARFLLLANEDTLKELRSLACKNGLSEQTVSNGVCTFCRMGKPQRTVYCSKAFSRNGNGTFESSI